MKGFYPLTYDPDHLRSLRAHLLVGGDVHEPYFTAGDEDELTEAFTAIIGGLRSCSFAIEGEIDPEAAGGGHVFLNGEEVPYDEENGWRVVDERTLELVGAACEEFRFTLAVELTATFPCGAVVF